MCRQVWKVFGRNPARALREMLAAGAGAHASTADSHLAAVRNVSFEVYQGETFVVMGLSGSGKSTLVRCISRLTEATHGEILVDGQDLLRISEAELRQVRRHKISMVFQNFGLFPHRTVLDNVAYGLEIQGQPRAVREERAVDIIKMVGLSGWEKHYPRQLSGGMQQRVGLARALAVDPQIILFDEPFSALDPLIRREMQDELLRLQATMHRTSVFITHDFAEALKLGDRVAIMRSGELVQVGTPEELVLHPSNDYVAAFTRDAPRGKVLSANAVMRPVPPAFAEAGAPSVRAADKLELILPIVAAHESPVAVHDADGALVGCVDRATVMNALAG